MKKLVFGLVIAILAAMMVAPAVFAQGEPDLTIEWDGDSVCGVVYNVAGGFETCDSFTQFATSGADVYGDFDVFVEECGSVTSYFDADVDKGDNGAACDVMGTIAYQSAVGTETDGQALSLFAASDCKAEMEVDANLDCDSLWADYDIDVEGCEWVVAVDAINVDDCDECVAEDTLSILSMNEGQGFANISGMQNSYGMVAGLNILSEDGEGVLAIEAEGSYVAFDGIQIGNGSLEIVAEYCDGIDVWDYENYQPVFIVVGQVLPI